MPFYFPVVVDVIGAFVYLFGVTSFVGAVKRRSAVYQFKESDAQAPNI
jgi:hypothetical protein